MKGLDSLSARLRRGLKAAALPVMEQLAARRVDFDPQLWGLYRDTSDFLALDGSRLADLTRTYGSPLFVVDAARLDANAAQFLRVPEGASRGVECYYSYKTNPVSGVLARLHGRGIGAEVISEYELWLAQRLGVPGERIVLNGPGRTPSALKTAIEIGALVQLNHREEIPLLSAIARGVGKPCRVGVRVVTSTGWGGQFGESIAGGNAIACYRELVNRKEFDVTALHAHLGGEIASADQVRGFVQELLDFAGVLRQEFGLQVPILDFGGSLACPTTSSHSQRDLRLNRALGTDLCPRPPEQVLDIASYVRELVQGVEERCAAENWPRPRIFVEPGRALTGNASFLLLTVASIKQSGAAGLAHAILDGGVNIAEPMRGEYHQIFCAQPARPEERRYRLVGPICTPMDTLKWSWRLPRLEPGDVLCVMDAGAYFVPFSTSFSFPQPAIAMLDAGGVSLLRRAERFEDLVARDATPAVASHELPRGALAGNSDL